MTFMAGVAWSVTATFGLQIIALFALSVRPGTTLDLVGGVACQSAAFLLTLFLIVRVHAPDRSLRDVLALRPTNWGLYLLAAGLGFLLEGPFTSVADLIERRWPPSADELAARAQAFDAPTLTKKIAVVIAAAIVGPLVEEMFFRGGLYRGIRRGHSALLTTLGVALFFAFAHLEWRHFVPIFLIGLVITYARAASGSLLPGLIIHITFNATSVLSSFADSGGPTPAEIQAQAQTAATLPPSLALLGAGGTILLLLTYHLVAAKSTGCAAARALDLT